MIVVMDNFRVKRRPVQPLRSIDSFSAPTARKQIVRPLRSTAPEALLPVHLPGEVVGAPQDALAPPVVIPREHFVEHQQQPDAPVVAASGQLSPFDLTSIQDIEKPKNRLTSGRVFRKWFFRGGLAVLALLIVTGGLLFGQGLLKLHKVFKGGAANVAALQANVSPSLLKGEGDGRVNILLLGNGGDGHDGPDLTDTMMLASIDPVNKTADLLSIPRDLWVQVPSYGSMKINAAYEVGKYNYLGKIDDSNANTQGVEAGFKLADQVVENVIGVNIDYNALVNFTSFKQAVDSVGGVR